MDKQATVDQIGAILRNPKVQAALLAAGGAGAAGGYLSSRADRKGETRGERRSRILRNALLSAGAGGLAVGAGTLGYEQLRHALPAEDIDPVSDLGESLFRLGGASTAGVGADRLLRPGRQTAAKKVLDTLGVSASKEDSLDQLKSMLKNDPKLLKGLNANDEVVKNYLRSTGIRSDVIRGFTGDKDILKTVDDTLGKGVRDTGQGIKDLFERSKTQTGGGVKERAKYMATEVGDLGKAKAKDIGSKAKDLDAKQIGGASRTAAQAARGMIKRHPVTAAVGLGFLSPEIWEHGVAPSTSFLGSAFKRRD